MKLSGSLEVASIPVSSLFRPTLLCLLNFGLGRVNKLLWNGKLLRCFVKALRECLDFLNKVLNVELSNGKIVKLVVQEATFEVQQHNIGSTLGTGTTCSADSVNVLVLVAGNTNLNDAGGTRIVNTT